VLLTDEHHHAVQLRAAMCACVHRRRSEDALPQRDAAVWLCAVYMLACPVSLFLYVDLLLSWLVGVMVAAIRRLAWCFMVFSRLNTYFGRLVQRLLDSTRPCRKRLVHLLQNKEAAEAEIPLIDSNSSLDLRQVVATLRFQQWMATTCLGALASQVPQLHTDFTISFHALS
jgi:hypothetical protein